jgi:hypothetical protein
MQTEFFMCKVDYEHHLEGDSHGTRVFSDIEDLKTHRKCVSQCGIVKVKIELVEVVQDSDYNILR